MLRLLQSTITSATPFIIIDTDSHRARWQIDLQFGVMSVKSAINSVPPGIWTESILYHFNRTKNEPHGVLTNASCAAATTLTCCVNYTLIYGIEHLCQTFIICFTYGDVIALRNERTMRLLGVAGRRGDTLAKGVSLFCCCCCRVVASNA